MKVSAGKITLPDACKCGLSKLEGPLFYWVLRISRRRSQASMRTMATATEIPCEKSHLPLDENERFFVKDRN
jgi:hypothetical protein